MSCDVEIPVAKEIVPVAQKESLSKVVKDPLQEWEDRVRKQGQIQQERVQLLKECSSQWEEELRQRNQPLLKNESREFPKKWEGEMQQRAMDCETQRRMCDSRIAAWETQLRGGEGNELNQRYLNSNCGFCNEHVYYPYLNHSNGMASYFWNPYWEEYRNHVAQTKRKGEKIKAHSNQIRQNMETHAYNLKNSGTSIHHMLINSERPLKEKIQILHDKGNAIREKITQRRSVPSLDYAPFYDFDDFSDLNPSSSSKACYPKMEYCTEDDGRNSTQFGKINVETFDENGVQCRSVHASLRHRTINSTPKHFIQNTASS